MSVMLTTFTQSQLLDCLCAVAPLTVDRLSDGGLFTNGVHVPCMEGFSVCQNCLILCTFTPDSCLNLSTHSSISSGVLFFTSTILLLPFTKTQKKINTKKLGSDIPELQAIVVMSAS